jgi:predicted PurR-regulated permease PerM
VLFFVVFVVIVIVIVVIVPSASLLFIYSMDFFQKIIQKDNLIFENKENIRYFEDQDFEHQTMEVKQQYVFQRCIQDYGQIIPQKHQLFLQNYFMPVKISKNDDRFLLFH